MVDIDLDAIKDGQRKVWSMGDYPDVARRIEEVAEVAVERSGASAGESLLDVATGSGNAALAAAARGATVTGLDLTPKLLEVARTRASESGYEIDFIEGDAENLPFADASFDCVTSCFGVIFAPGQARAAAELVRVARPGAKVVFTGWTPEGVNGQMLKTVGSYMPAPPPGLDSPVMWGAEDHVRSLFADQPVELSFERREVTFEDESIESWLAHNEKVLGPIVMAKAALEPQGRWEDLRRDLTGLYREHNKATDGSMHLGAEYLLTVADVAAS
jgi:SAM-dependent methyltransferase